jgi:leader peptidase (prepilin peptidase)/N-methyltransferase
MIRIYGTGLAALLGLAFGSFLNVCLTRWPEAESVVKPRSHCRSCGRTLAWWENIPLLSWIALRAKCRTCSAKISWRYPMVELLIAVLWACFWWRSYGAFLPLVYGLGMLGFTWVIVAIAFLDAEHLWIPNFLTLPVTIFGGLWSISLMKAVERDFKLPDDPWSTFKDMSQVLIWIAIPAALVLLIRWAYWLIRRREGIGIGDAKLMAMLGAWLGLSGAMVSFAVGVLLGAIFALIVLAIPAGRRESDTWLTSRLPLGTFLCVGGIISALWGNTIAAAYLHWVGL